MKKIKKFTINRNDKIKKVLKKINNNKIKICFVVDKNNKLLGSVTDGDIRRHLINKLNINEKVYKISNKKPKFILKKNIKFINIKKLFLKLKVDIIPIVNTEKVLVDLLFKSNFLTTRKLNKNIFKKNNLSKTNVFIMAGGMGKRLDPVTRIFPKPLVPLKNKTIVENIIDTFLKFKINKFYFSLNYKAELIKAYFKNKKTDYQINYLDEKKPLGTAGSLSMVKNKIKTSFFLTNCDVIFNIDYSLLLDHHNKSNSDFTIVVSKIDNKIPYGVCTVDKQNNLKEIIEKPNFKKVVTTGLYVIHPRVIKNLKSNQYLDMNEFIKLILKSKKKVNVFTISKNKWFDVGQLKDYKKKLKLLKY